MRFLFDILNIIVILCILSGAVYMIGYFNQLKNDIEDQLPNYITDQRLSPGETLQDYLSDNPIGLMEAFCDQ